MLNPGLPQSVTGWVRVGPQFDADCSAPIVFRYGVPVGVYIDDTTPNIRDWVAIAVQKYRNVQHAMVVVSLDMGHPDVRYGPYPVVHANEYYPKNSGQPLSNWPYSGLPRGRQAYIVQRRYGGYALEEGGRDLPPSSLQYLAYLARVKLQRPRLILTY